MRGIENFFIPVASVLKHFSFQRFLRLRNPQKPIKTCKNGETRKFGNLCPNSRKPLFDLS